MRVRLLRMLLVLAAGCGGGFVLAGGGAGRAQGAPIAFSVPSGPDPIHAWGEPTIGVNPVGGGVFVSGPTGTGTQRSAWEGSLDGGQTFRVITPNAPPTAIQSLEDPPGGGDTDRNFDLSGKVYFTDLYALLCDRTATSSDGGATVFQSFDGCDQAPG